MFISYGGSGCPQGSVATAFNNDRTAFTLIYDNYVASSAPNVPLSESRKNCNLNLNMHIPQGYSYSVLALDTRGFLALDQGVSAYSQTGYYFQGELDDKTVQRRWDGPINGDNYAVRDNFDQSNVVWSPCGRSANVNIATSIRVDNSRNRQGQGLMTADSTDGKVKQIFSFRWRKC
ncbi:hypothetical protein HK102_011706 [Quaeritorhiza haematococci]|nr:hypothetical protein HK102_011706 [Quaeritorhiza haematococci]